MTQAFNLKLKMLPGAYAVVHLPLTAQPPAPGPAPSELWSLTRSNIEYSLVCSDSEGRAMDLPGSKIDTGWDAYYLQGPVPFTMTGIIARLTSPLAQSRVGCFVISTFDSDFILVKESDRDAAQTSWHQAGITVLGR